MQERRTRILRRTHWFYMRWPMGPPLHPSGLTEDPLPLYGTSFIGLNGGPTGPAQPVGPPLNLITRQKSCPRPIWKRTQVVLMKNDLGIYDLKAMVFQLWDYFAAFWSPRPGYTRRVLKVNKLLQHLYCSSYNILSFVPFIGNIAFPTFPPFFESLERTFRDGAQVSCRIVLNLLIWKWHPFNMVLGLANRKRSTGTRFQEYGKSGTTYEPAHIHDATSKSGLPTTLYVRIALEFHGTNCWPLK